MPKAPNRPSAAHRQTRPGVKRRNPYPPVSIPTSSSSAEKAVSRSPSKKWTPEEDEVLVEARKRGMNWDPIAAKYFPKQSGNSCRKRHERLMFQRAKGTIQPATIRPQQQDSLGKAHTAPTPRRALTDTDRKRMCLYHEEHPTTGETEIGGKLMPCFQNDDQS